MTTKIRVALLFGGRSSEHSISCATAGSVLAHIDRDRFDVVPIGITKQGEFVLQADDPSRMTLAQMPEVGAGDRVVLPTTTDSKEIVVADSSAGALRALGDVDIVFPILHGKFGEDGTVQGMLELAGLPYVGNGVLASAVGMDKHFTKTVLEHAGLAVAPWETVRRRDWQSDPDAVRERVAHLAAPVFVKPARAGSSVGVSRVDSPEDTAAFAAAMDLAFAEDSRVLVEAGCPGREVEVAVLAGRDGGPARASLPGEIVLQEGEFYDFEAKYVDADRAKVVCPADLDEATIAAVQDVAVRAFDAIEGAGLARVDVFVTESGDIVVNEVNTMPGFTTISMFPQAWGATGIAYGDLITELIELGLAEDR